MKFNRKLLQELVKQKKAQGITKSFIIYDMGLNSTSILHAWLSGKSTPSFVNGVKLMNYFDITDVQEFITDEK